MKIKGGLLLLLFLCIGSGLFAQNDSTFAPGYKRNIVKWNMTPFILWSSRDINISYERILKPYRSFSVNLGYFELSVSGLFDSLFISNSKYKGGFTISGDYRFYFKNRNRRTAPDGLYWGPYGSYHYTSFGSNVDVIKNDLINGSFRTDISLSIFSAGVELGYQFVIKKRLTVDLVFMGPAISFYGGKILLNGKYDVNQDHEYYEAIRDILINKFPFLDDLIKQGEVKGNGVSTSFGFGMRYLIQIGYRF
jgi:hypothetical protein